jgi:hypothetical protein
MNSEGIAAVVVPVCLLAIPVIAILTSHQRKMAQLIYTRHVDGSDKLQERVAHLELEVQEVKDRLNASAIENDRLRSALARDTHVDA